MKMVKTMGVASGDDEALAKSIAKNIRIEVASKHGNIHVFFFVVPPLE